MDMNLVGRNSEPAVFEYTEKDVIMYALGVGAQPDELSFIYEGVPGGLQVVPSFGVLAPATMPSPIGDDVDYPRLFHVEQRGSCN